MDSHLSSNLNIISSSPTAFNLPFLSVSAFLFYVVIPRSLHKQFSHCSVEFTSSNNIRGTPPPLYDVFMAKLILRKIIWEGNFSEMR